MSPSSSAERATSATAAPASARARATSCPMPRPAPVTSATDPLQTAAGRARPSGRQCQPCAGGDRVVSGGSEHETIPSYGERGREQAPERILRCRSGSVVSSGCSTRGGSRRVEQRLLRRQRVRAECDERMTPRQIALVEQTLATVDLDALAADFYRRAFAGDPSLAAMFTSDPSSNGSGSPPSSPPCSGRSGRSTRSARRRTPSAPAIATTASAPRTTG